MSCVYYVLASVFHSRVLHPGSDVEAPIAGEKKFGTWGSIASLAKPQISFVSSPCKLGQPHPCRWFFRSNRISAV